MRTAINLGFFDGFRVILQEGKKTPLKKIAKETLTIFKTQSHRLMDFCITYRRSSLYNDITSGGENHV